MRLKDIADRYNQLLVDGLVLSELKVTPPLKRYKKTIYLDLEKKGEVYSNGLTTDTVVNVLLPQTSLENALSRILNGVNELDQLRLAEVKALRDKVAQNLIDLNAKILTLGWV